MNDNLTNLLLYVTNILIIISYILHFLLQFYNNKYKISGTTGFNITNDTLNEDNRINIVEKKGYITVYNLKKRVIEIATKNYYGSTITDFGIPLIELGILETDNNNNKYLNIIKKILPNLKLIYLFSFIAFCINNVTYSISDAKASMIALFICLILYHMLIAIKTEGLNHIHKKLKRISYLREENFAKIMKYLENDLKISKIIYFTEFIMIIRTLIIIIN